MATKSWRMAERQAKRDNGRYAKMNRCDFCKKALGEDYCSLTSVDEKGRGLVCCAVCCDKHEPLRASK